MPSNHSTSTVQPQVQSSVRPSSWQDSISLNSRLLALGLACIIGGSFLLSINPVAILMILAGLMGTVYATIKLVEKCFE